MIFLLSSIESRARHMRGGLNHSDKIFSAEDPIHHPLKREAAGGGIHAALTSVFGLKHIPGIWSGFHLPFPTATKVPTMPRHIFVEEAISLQGDLHVTGSMSDTAPKKCVQWFHRRSCDLKRPNGNRAFPQNAQTPASCQFDSKEQYVPGKPVE